MNQNKARTPPPCVRARAKRQAEAAICVFTVWPSFDTTGDSLHLSSHFIFVPINFLGGLVPYVY